MIRSWHSPRGLRRGLIIAMAALSFWMCWLLGWKVQSIFRYPVTIEINLVPSSCSICSRIPSNSKRSQI
jgi:hypothetical protein